MSPSPIRRFHQVFQRHWVSAEATVDACSWVHDHDYTGVDAGHYDVRFSYGPLTRSMTDLDQPLRGQFRRSGSRQIAPYHPGERIPILYNSKNPGRFHLAGTSPSYEKLETILAMALFALLAGYLLFIY